MSTILDGTPVYFASAVYAICFLLIVSSNRVVEALKTRGVGSFRIVLICTIPFRFYFVLHDLLFWNQGKFNYDLFFAYRAANSIIGGGTPIYFNYPPLYYALVTLPVFFWRDPRAIKALAIMFEIGTIYLTYRLGQVHFSEDVATHAAILYGLSPISLATVYAFYTQGDIVIGFLILLITLLFIQGRLGFTSFLVGLGGAFKWMTLFVAPPLALRESLKSRVWFMISAGIVFIGFHIPFLIFWGVEPFLHAGAYVPLLEGSVAGRYIGILPLLIVIVMPFVFGLYSRQHNLDVVAAIVAEFILIQLLLLTRNLVNPQYFLWFLPCLCLLIGSKSNKHTIGSLCFLNVSVVWIHLGTYGAGPLARILPRSMLQVISTIALAISLIDLFLICLSFRMRLKMVTPRTGSEHTSAQGGGLQTTDGGGDTIPSQPAWAFDARVKKFKKMVQEWGVGLSHARQYAYCLE